MVEIRNFLSYDLKKCLLFVSIGLKLKWEFKKDEEKLYWKL